VPGLAYLITALLIQIKNKHTMCNLYDVGLSPNTKPKAWERRVISAITELKNSLNIRKTDSFSIDFFQPRRLNPDSRNQTSELKKQFPGSYS